MKDTKDIEKRTGLPISELVRLRLMGYKVTVEKDKPTTIDDIVKEMVADCIKVEINCLTSDIHDIEKRTDNLCKRLENAICELGKFEDIETYAIKEMERMKDEILTAVQRTWGLSNHERFKIIPVTKGVLYAGETPHTYRLEEYDKIYVITGIRIINDITNGTFIMLINGRGSYYTVVDRQNFVLLPRLQCLRDRTLIEIRMSGNTGESNGKQMKFAVIGHCYRKG